MKIDIEYIIRNLSIKEKIKLLSGKNFWFFHGIKKYNIPSIQLSDGPHGLRKQDGKGDHIGLNTSIKSTCFPTSSCLASSWDNKLIYSIGEGIANECIIEDIAILLGPGANIKRHPLCGRNFEYFSEDPLLSGKFASNYIKGVQSKGIGTSLKHFVANNQETNRMTINSCIDEKTLREIYLKPFEIAICESNPWTVMNSYNLVNGTYTGENLFLLNNILRKEWNYNGLVISDWGACNDRTKGLIASQDIEMPSSSNQFDKSIYKDFKKGLIKEKQINKSVKRLLNTIIKYNQNLKKRKITEKSYNHKLAVQAACESFVLLKNNNNALPLKFNSKFSLIGKLAKIPRYQGSGSSLINPLSLTIPYEEIKKISSFKYSDGYNLESFEINEDLINEAIAVSKDSDYIIIFAGLPEIAESEGFDRKDIELPKNQNYLIDCLSKLNKKIIVILFNGGPINLPWKEKVDSILECYLPGEGIGEAVSKTIFGLNNPSGKLAETFPNNLAEFPANINSSEYNKNLLYKESIFIGYRFYKSFNISPLYCFGHGLSYTDFEYSDFKIKLNSDKIIISYNIKNIGHYDGKEISQIYISKSNSKTLRPKLELIQYDKSFIPVGTMKQIKKSIPIYYLQKFDTMSQTWKIENGLYKFSLGKSINNIIYAKEITINYGTNHFSEQEVLYKKLYKKNIFKITNNEYLKLFNYNCLNKIPKNNFHLNSTMLEIRKKAFGKLLYFFVYKFSIKQEGKNISKVNKLMIENSLNQMPLRALVLFSGGKISFKFIKFILILLNI